VIDLLLCYGCRQIEIHGPREDVPTGTRTVLTSRSVEPAVESIYAAAGLVRTTP
jgi:hypothetical protein